MAKTCGGTSANLNNACLESVDLSGANLKDANLTKVDLRGANLDDAKVPGTLLRFD